MLFFLPLVYSFTCNITTLCQLQHMLYNDLWNWKDWRTHHNSLFWVLLEQISISTKFCNQNSQQSSHDSNQYFPHTQLYRSAQSLALHSKFKNYFPPVSKTMKSTFIESNCHNEWMKQTNKLKPFDYTPWSNSPHSSCITCQNFQKVGGVHKLESSK